MSVRFLVIGAGPTGLAVAKALSAAGIAYEVAEATDHVGGNWAHGVYETAHIISSRKTTEYPDWPMPADWPDFPSAQQMRTYYDAFADAHALRASIRFGTTVQSVRPRADHRWDVSLSDGDDVYDGVVVCNGHHWHRDLPAWTQRFAGELLHSKDYKRPSQLHGKRVLVVGGGNSGCDIASEAARVATSATWSLRRGYWFLPKSIGGRPSVEWMRPWAPVALQRAVLRTLVRVVLGRYRDFGLPDPDHRLFEAHPTVNSEVFHYLQHGRLVVRADVVGVDGHEVRFADGRVESFDLIVCATGYHVSFPFLPDGMIPVTGKCPELIAGQFRPGCRHLYVLGAYQARYGIGPLLRPLAIGLVRWIELQDELTSPLGDVLQRLGVRSPPSHLVDPHAAMAAMRRAEQLWPLLRWRAQRADRALQRTS